MPEIALKIDRLTKCYGSLVAVHDLSLEICAGEVFGFLGPNGAGKTTAIRMMCGLLKPNAGRVLVLGVDIASDPSACLRVGVCPQEIVLWSKLTCLEQLVYAGQLYGLSAAKARSRAVGLLGDLDLAKKKDQLPQSLSGGMQRRLNLALALVHDPETVVLDEPEAGLDPQSRVRVREYIRSLARRKTVVLTTHNMDEADRVADRVAIIDHGELLALGAPEDLKRSRGEGDVIEIGLKSPADSDRAQMALSSLALAGRAEIHCADGALVVRALNAVQLLPRILEVLTAEGIPQGEVRLRENTLEDVFIQLTGKRLRE
ncbi:MAG TPA: ABC transporter ATP-binding protein [Anaerolineaceae bacterium]|nr:ABC transporter ATP-binding protein [Anaerolineaceae bacterium]